MRRAKDRATDMPDADLFGRVKEVTGSEQKSSETSRSRAQNGRRRPRQSQRRKKTTASR
jgi:hypothetical protein